jgi:hypothetical protein
VLQRTALRAVAELDRWAISLRLGGVFDDVGAGLGDLFEEFFSAAPRCSA